MRILFTFIGGTGHLHPLLPVARAAAAAGHVVGVAGSGRPVGTIADAGFELLPTSRPPAVVADPGPTRDLAPLPPVDREQDELDFAESFARRGATRHAAALLDVVRDWRPDVVVRDEVDFGAGVAAERVGVPCAVVLVLAAGSLLRRDLVAGPLDEVRARHGLGADPGLAMLDGDLVLSPFPPSFRHPDAPLPAGAFSFRPTATAAPGPALAATPTVYFTLGTSFGRRSGDLIERVLAGLRDFPGQVVVTVGSDLDPAEIAAQPEHIRVERYVDQADLLPSCDLVISHGGSGSVVGALAHGLPTLLLPLGADQTHNAERVTRLGVGLELDAAAADSKEIRDAVHALLDDPRYRQAARTIRGEIAALPGPDETVPLLEALR